jgi:hypothetical protein
MPALDFTQLPFPFVAAPLDLTQLQQLPFQPSIPFQNFSTTIDGTNYLRWNARDKKVDPLGNIITQGAWYFDLLDETSSPILTGIKILLGVAMGRRCEDPRWPLGVFMAQDMLNSGIDAGLDDLGTRIIVYFYPLAQWFSQPAT